MMWLMLWIHQKLQQYQQILTDVTDFTSQWRVTGIYNIFVSLTAVNLTIPPLSFPRELIENESSSPLALRHVWLSKKSDG